MQAIRLNRLAYFSAVAETGSFTKAADRLGITKAVVSQQVSRLEAELGTSLLVRTTRRVEPTEAGRLLHARCVLIFSEVEEAVGEIAQTNAEPTGTLRITAPNDYGASTIAPVIAAFTRMYPACNVELQLSDTKVDLIADHFDLSIRVGWLDDSSYHARRIGTFRQLLVASSDLARDWTASVPEDLIGLPFIANASLKEPLVWRFTKDDFDPRTVRLRQNILTNSTPAALAAVLAGGGISVLPDFLTTGHLEGSRLVQLLPAWSLPAGGVYAVYPAARFRPPKVTAFVEMLSRYRSDQTKLGTASRTATT